MTLITDVKRYTALYTTLALLFSASSIALIFICRSLFDYKVIELNSNMPASAIIVIDAGHGGEDAGAIGVNGKYEKDVNLSLAIMLKDILTANGIEAVLTRNDDTLLYDKSSDYVGHKKEQDLLNRRRIAESYDSAIFISIHMNAFPDERYSGLQVYYSLNDSSSKDLANSIQTITKEHIQSKNNRSIKPSDGIYLLDRLKCPAVLIECGFVSNPTECELLFKEDYQRKLALCIAHALTDHINSLK